MKPTKINYRLLGFTLLFSLLTLVTSCSNLETKKIPLSDRKQLFPYGKYKTVVTVFQKDKERDFTGIFQTAAEKNVFSGVGALATSLFKVEEEKPSGKISIEIFQRQFKNFEDRLKQTYEKLSVLLSYSVLEPIKPPFKLTKKDTDRFPLEMVIDDPQKTKILFVSYDENKIPKELKIETNEMQLKIEMLSYKLDET